MAVLKKTPIIAAARTQKDAKLAASSNIGAVVMLGGDIEEVRRNIEIVRSIDEEKIIFVHLDLVEGLGRDPKAVSFLADYAKPDGMLTTKNALIRAIKRCGLLAGQRCFVLDSQSYEIAVKSVQANKPHLVELMPGIMPRAIKQFSSDIAVPVIAGGLIDSVEDVEVALKAGAVGISTSKQELWDVYSK